MSGAAPASRPVGGDPWRCGVCAAANPEEDAQCRVCRTERGATGVPVELDEDTYRAAPLFAVLPLTLVLLVAGWFVARGAPTLSSWSSMSAAHPWQADVRVNRAAELRLGIVEIRALALELRAALPTGGRPDGWPARLTHTLTRWQIYGDASRYRGGEAAEVEISAILQDLASLRFQLDGSLSPQAATEELDRLLVRLDRLEETLPDV